MLQASIVNNGDMHATTYECGCVYRHWIGKPSPKNGQWEQQCKTHKAQERPVDNTGRKCCCLNVGEADGPTTCWQHHDCWRGDCTHMDNDDSDYNDGEEDLNDD